MENYQKSALMMTSLFNEEEKEYLFHGVKNINDAVENGFSVDSAELKIKFRVYLLIIRHMFIWKKKVPADHYGENFMRVDDETLFAEAKRLFKEMVEEKKLQEGEAERNGT